MLVKKANILSWLLFLSTLAKGRKVALEVNNNLLTQIPSFLVMNALFFCTVCTTLLETIKIYFYKCFQLPSCILILLGSFQVFTPQTWRRLCKKVWLYYTVEVSTFSTLINYDSLCVYTLLRCYRRIWKKGNCWLTYCLFLAIS